MDFTTVKKCSLLCQQFRHIRPRILQVDGKVASLSITMPYFNWTAVICPLQDVTLSWTANNWFENNWNLHEILS